MYILFLYAWSKNCGFNMFAVNVHGTYVTVFGCYDSENSFKTLELLLIWWWARLSINNFFLCLHGFFYISSKVAFKLVRIVSFDSDLEYSLCINYLRLFYLMMWTVVYISLCLTCSFCRSHSLSCLMFYDHGLGLEDYKFVYNC